MELRAQNAASTRRFGGRQSVGKVPCVGPYTALVEPQKKEKEAHLRDESVVWTSGLAMGVAPHTKHVTDLF